MKWYEMGPFTIFDVETNGMSPKIDEIIEISAVKVNTEGRHSYFDSLVKPASSIPPELSRIHHITNEMLENEDDFSTIGSNFRNFINNSILVAHNARFDLAFLQESLSRHYISLWNGKTMDSIKIIKQAFPGLPSYSLKYLKMRFGLGNGTGQAHRAGSDVQWTLEIFSMAMQALINSRAS